MAANKVHQKDVRVGAVYAVRVSGAIAPVRIDAEKTSERRRGSFCVSLVTHWRGTNLRTNREVYVRSAAKLRYELVRCEGGCGRWIEKLTAPSRCGACKGRALINEENNAAPS